MSRGEWVTLPDGTRLHKSLDGRQYFASSDGTVMLGAPGLDSIFNVGLPLAEFEALLFGAAASASDDYTRAAVRFAEAWANEHVDADEYGKARIAFLALHREREKHGA